MSLTPTSERRDNERRGAADRRKALRYPPAVEAVQLGWWEGQQFVSAAARFLDVSTSGAALAVTGLEVDHPEVWVRISATVSAEWVRARVVGVSAIEGNERRVRLAFAVGCPYDFFKAAVWGEPPRESQTPRPCLSDPGDTSHPQPETRPSRTERASFSRMDAPISLVLTLQADQDIPFIVAALRPHLKSMDQVATLPSATVIVVGLTAAVLLAIVALEWLTSIPDLVAAACRH